jgi:hypothetical protein
VELSWNARHKHLEKMMHLLTILDVKTYLYMPSFPQGMDNSFFYWTSVKVNTHVNTWYITSKSTIYLTITTIVCSWYTSIWHNNILQTDQKQFVSSFVFRQNIMTTNTLSDYLTMRCNTPKIIGQHNSWSIVSIWKPLYL